MLNLGPSNTILYSNTSCANPMVPLPIAVHCSMGNFIQLQIKSQDGPTLVNLRELCSTRDVCMRAFVRACGREGRYWQPDLSWKIAVCNR